MEKENTFFLPTHQKATFLRTWMNGLNPKAFGAGCRPAPQEDVPPASAGGAPFSHRALTLDVENIPLAEISPTHILLLGKNINSFVIPSIPLPTSKRISIGDMHRFM